MKTAWSAAVRSASYYEMRAHEVQAIAKEMRDPWCRKVLRGVVDDYLRLAGQQLDIERQREKLRKGAA
jgi:hypothetical protein